MLIIQKFGGSSVADPARMRRAAELVAGAWREGHDVAAVLSAQGDTTDELLEKAALYNPAPPARELDALLAAGEQMSTALMAMTLSGMGVPAVSLGGWQAELLTDAEHGAAHIRRLSPRRLRRELAARRVAVVAGFQGVDEAGDVTTLGRGGSDTTAAALAAALSADRCRIYTDVAGVYTADPRKVPGARRLERLTYEEMLALAELGAQVLAARSVRLAARWGVPLEVLSSGEEAPGTLISAAEPGESRPALCSVTCGRAGAEAARVSAVGEGADGDTARRMREAAEAAGLTVLGTETGPRSASVLVAPGGALTALRAAHAALFGA